ncbi:hypothetical protein N9P66_01690 [Salibacteraceae bacterium]|nr:hypothetical protein [Salibacteraceae bacterium]
MNNPTSDKALVGVFYARPDKTKKLLLALENTDGVLEYFYRFFCDLPKEKASEQIWANHRKTVEIIEGFLLKYPGILVVREQNLGLSKNMIRSISEALEHHNSCVILEDDIIVSKKCLRHFEKALAQYEEHENIWGIAGNSFLNEKESAKLPDSYMLPIMTTWGWATWADRWEKFLSQYPVSFEQMDNVKSIWGFDFGGFPYKQMLLDNRAGKVDSWAIEFNYTLFMNKGYFVFPKKSLCENIGVGLDATHTLEQQQFMQKITDDSYLPSQYQENIDIEVINAVSILFKKKLEKPGFSKRIVNRLFN